MKTREIILSAAALLVLSGAPAFAQSTTPAPSTTPPGEIQQRKDNQQDRIANGVQDGQLTTADRDKINNQQNHVSNQIYDDKHNAATQHNGPSEIGQREQNQQDRIAQGVRSGQLTAGETAHLENQQQGVHREAAADRQANGGHLTGADRRAINQSENRASRNIYNKKHNGRTR
jgi:hypothetical protein